MRLFREAVILQDVDGWNPLHKAVSQSGALVKFIQFPECAKMVNTKGFTPLHAAMSGFASVKGIQAILDACPTSATIVNLYGSTSLHSSVSCILVLLLFWKLFLVLESGK
mgnify:CR=1 FL=1